MAIDIEQFKIEQVRRILASLGWKITATDTTGDSLRITAETKKTQQKEGQ